MRLYVGLVHFPVYNKHQETIASAITPIDIHDFARLAKTFGVKGFFVVTPLEDQQDLAHRILRHWTCGYGAQYNRHRKEALGLVRVVPTLDAALEEVTEAERTRVKMVATDAAVQEKRPSTYASLRKRVFLDEPILLLFGTAWGLHEAVLQRVDHVLDPVSGRSGYNHLSVRTAAAIILDRLVGRSFEVC